MCLKVTEGSPQCDPKGEAMHAQECRVPQGLPYPTEWYAVQTRSRHERLVAHHLGVRGIARYIPIVTETHLWSDRKKKVDMPLFPGYVFVRIMPANEARVRVLCIPGVVRLVGSEPGGTAIPDDQIQSIKTLLDQNLAWTSYPFLKTGQRVRVRGGALDGVEGIFMKRSGLDTLVISVDAIQRSLSISVQGYNLEAI
jgi:transcription antitermination factor NusG